jgi:hypothetical protein
MADRKRTLKLRQFEKKRWFAIELTNKVSSEVIVVVLGSESDTISRPSSE